MYVPSLFLILAQAPARPQVEVPPLSTLGMFAVAAWVLTGLLAGWYVASRGLEIRYATLADGQRAQRSLPLSFRLLLPFTPNFKRFRREKYARKRVEVEKQLVSAGYDTVLRADEFLALRVLMPIVLGPILILALSLLTSRIPGGLGEGIRERQWMLFIAIMGYMFLRPTSWLRSTIKSRHLEIERALPFILDLLTLSVEAGLDFMTSLRRLIERRKVDALSEEFIRAVREMQVGRTRKEALKDMADRAGQTDLTSVVTALIQADELGVGIGTILRIQGEQMRQRRFQRAEKLANEAPVKLLFPLVCFIFPCVFLVLLGPIFLEMIKSGF